MIAKSHLTRNRSLSRGAALTLASVVLTTAAIAQSPVYSPGSAWGTASVAALREASGLAASWRNPKVLWTHNDGGRKRFYAITPAGLHLATFNLDEKLGDVEAIAVGPGPVAGASYLYIADIGGNDSPGDVRNTVRILRVPEPEVTLDFAGDPPETDFSPAEVFTLAYSDGESYDAEAMFIEPESGELYLFTKSKVESRMYHAVLDTGLSGPSLPLNFVATVPVPEPSDADISRDGRQIILRHENAAFTWSRAMGATVETTMAQAPRSAPVIGEPLEPNGEAITFLTDGSGYMTLSEKENSVLYHFQAQTPMAPVAQSRIAPRSVFTGSTVQVPAPVSGYPPPAFVWRRNGEQVPGQTTSALRLTNVSPDQEGTWEVTATNAHGSASASFTLTVRPKPDLRVTEVMALPAETGGGADWWELTSFETVPVDLSGWRFNDDGGDLDNAFVFPAGLTILPGESIVFVDDLSPAQFRAWWGPGVPAGSQIVSYDGGGLALNTPGDTIRIWNDSTTDVNATVTARTFGASTAGVSLNYDPSTNAFGGQSQAGVNGVFTSVSLTDRGSPGIWLPPAAEPALSVTAAAGILRMEIQTSALHWYTLEASEDPGAEFWTPESSFQSAANGPRFFEAPITDNRRFFRVRVR